jgi:chemotaxis protein CheX
MSIETVTVFLPSADELAELVEEIWTSFLGDDIVVGLDDPDVPAERMVAWVSISGEWTGHLQVLTTADGAGAIAASMFQMAPDDLSSAEVTDAFGEIANIVGGGVKGMLGAQTALSLPQVVLDARALVSPDAREHTTVHALWRGAPLEISLWERSTNGRNDTIGDLR